MSTKFNQLVNEMIGTDRASMRSEKLRSIRQDLTKSSSDIENLANHYQSVMEDETKAEKLRRAAEMIDKVRNILFDLQD